EGVAADGECVGPLACKRRENRIDLLAGAGAEDLDLKAHGTPSRFRIFHGRLSSWISRIDEYGDARRSRCQLTQQFKALRHQLGAEKIDAGQVATWPRQARDQSK